MKKLTKRQALIECKKMWRWLEKNPDKEKEHYCSDMNNRPDAACYACEYGNQNKLGCHGCILKSLWPTQPNFCLANTSPYYKWKKAEEPEVKTANAKIIADACVVELAKLRALNIAKKKKAVE